MADNPHLLLWLAILVPAAAAVYAPFAIYRRQERTRRYLARPLVAVRHQLDPEHGPFTRWMVDIRNEGDDAVNIESMTVVAGDEIIEWDPPLEPPQEYWSRVLYSAGVLRVQQVKGNVINPPRSITGKSDVLLFDAVVGGPRENISDAIRRLEIRLKCRSAAGETSIIRHRYGQR